MERMTNEQVDQLMSKRGFTLSHYRGSGMRCYMYANLDKTPMIFVDILPERREFKFTYIPKKSLCRLETNWCSPLTDKDHFRRVLKDIRKKATILENSIKEEEECMQQSISKQQD